MNVHAKAAKLLRLFRLNERINDLVDPDLKLRELVQKEIRELGGRKEEVDPGTGEIR